MLKVSFTDDALRMLVRECSRRFMYVCNPDFDFNKRRDYFEGMVDALFGCCMLLSNNWVNDSSFLVDCVQHERDYFFGGEKSE